jgi:hypothetical protein
MRRPIRGRTPTESNRCGRRRGHAGFLTFIRRFGVIAKGEPLDQGASVRHTDVISDVADRTRDSGHSAGEARQHSFRVAGHPWLKHEGFSLICAMGCLWAGRQLTRIGPKPTPTHGFLDADRQTASLVSDVMVLM